MLRSINKIYELNAHLFFFLLGSNRGQKPEEDDRGGGGLRKPKPKLKLTDSGRGEAGIW